MPVAVMAESTFSFRKLLDQCENQELEVGGVFSGLARRLSPGERALRPVGLVAGAG